MKKLFCIAALALLTLGIASCERENETNNDNTSNTPSNPSTSNDTTLRARQETIGEWVDLGLSVQWYSVNLGATAPEQYGDHYMWGEVWPRSIYSWATYSYGDREGENGNYTYTLYKYNTSASCGTVDSLITLQPSDDAATAVLGNGARIPTIVECQELLHNTSANLTTVNGITGYEFIANNGNSIFLPLAGIRDGNSFDGVFFGSYWSSSLQTANPDEAFAIGLSHDRYPFAGSTTRAVGRSVRPVRQN